MKSQDKKRVKVNRKKIGGLSPPIFLWRKGQICGKITADKDFSTKTP
jgi:hypothetical protein